MHTETKLATLGCMPDQHRGVVNTPVYRASTILFPTLAEFEAADRGQCAYATYGRYGTPASEQLEATLADLEGADHAIVTASGLAAITTTLLAFLKAGDHLLMVDTVYGPVRRFCDHELARFGIETTYYDPLVGADIKMLMRPNTRVVYVESPGSLTFEVQDIPAIAAVSHAHGALVVGDNTWGTPVYYKPFALGIDISIHSVTKYIAGHSDLVMGVISCNKAHYRKLLQTFRNMGASASGDNVYLAMRGLRTLGVRMKQHYENGMKVSEWLEQQPQVSHVIHPALPSHPQHALWQRDFTGACGLFAFVLKPVAHDKLEAMMDGLQHFGMGYSWGGFESLLVPVHVKLTRTATSWPDDGGMLLRIHVGLEYVGDLIDDLAAGFNRLM